MFSYLKRVVSSIVPWGSEHPVNDLEEQEQAIINIIRNMSTKDEETSENLVEEHSCLGESDTAVIDLETYECVHKTGKVTFFNNDYGLIDNVVHFEHHQVAEGLMIKLHDEVFYSVYKVRENEAYRVHKVYAVKGDDWETGGTSIGQPHSDDVKKVEEISAFTKFITGRVTKRRGRHIFIESANVWCNLDKIETSFIPIEGDWVELMAAVSVNIEVVNLCGDVVEVKSLKPLIEKNGFGRITLWSETKKEGAIENQIYFTDIECEDGYVPSFGDEVVYDAIESDQGTFRWRALVVLISNKKHESQIIKNPKTDTAGSSEKVDPFSDRDGISIVPAVGLVELELKEKKIIVFEVTNKGPKKQLLKYTGYNMRRDSLLSLLSPKVNDYFFISPNQTIQYTFECEGKFLGLFGETFFFYFKNFTIARRFEINVIGNKEMNRLLECTLDTAFETYSGRKYLPKDTKYDLILYGSRPWRQPKFLCKERKCVFNVPKNLFHAFMEGKIKTVNGLVTYAPYLKTDLNFEHYADKFHTLLYLEELQLKLFARNYDIHEVFLTQDEEYFVIKVNGLVEGRPSIIIGDRVVLTQPWLKTGKIKHVGFIHKIMATEIFVKFHPSFHEEYDGSQCNISFEPNINFLLRCHEAINRAVKVLGKQWLLPSAVNEKPSLINIDMPEELKFVEEAKQKITSSTEDKIKLCGKQGFNDSLTNPKKKTIVWNNKKLNTRQKLAVVNILEGKGRPLPYIVFGPPGTGKTSTLVELIIQIYRLFPESRILVTTPSNSAADLICERLIEYGDFKPGQLVRLLALYRVIEGLVSPQIIPYSTYFNTRENERVPDQTFKTNIKSSSANELCGRHRITVATCCTVGFLHFLGLNSGHFTHILVDEAGQTLEPEVLITATFQNVETGQVVLAGDPQQLGPVVCNSLAKHFGLDVSLMRRLISTFPYARDPESFPKHSGYDPRFITKLTINYRTVPEILSLPSQMFYNSDLFPAVSQTDSREAEIIKAFNFEVQNRTTPPAIIFHGIIGQNYRESDSPSWFNPHEIWQTVFYVRKLYSIGLNHSDIGIVSPYAKQVSKVKSLLFALDLMLPKVGSVEEFQGQERYVIIVTTVRSSPKYVNTDISHSLGFVASPQRLNVAITRARALLIIIGNPVLLSKDPYWINVIKYCIKNNSYTGCSLDSVFENDTNTDVDIENDNSESLTNDD